MKQSTEQVILITLKADETISQDSIDRAMALLKGMDERPNGSSLDRVVSRAEVQKIFGFKSPKSVDQYAKKGAFERVFLPGSSRAIGFSEQSVRMALSVRQKVA